MGIFDGILICTDLDGTLLRNDKSISAENIAAIEHFKREGGLFTFVTGRMPYFVSDMYERVRPNAPIGCINGAGVYDFAKGAYLAISELSFEAITLVRAVEERFPDVGVQVNTFRNVYFCKENDTMEIFRRRTGLPNLTCRYDEINEPIAKIIFGHEDEVTLLAVAAFLDAHPLSAGFSFIRSEETLYEILPAGVGKGTALVRIAECLSCDIAKTVAIGDFSNDVSMLRAAALGVAVANACPEAKAAADCVTVSNEEHALAAVIDALERGLYTL